MTIKDIARLSGCGVATVSRVLNNYPDVSEATRRRVMAVVEQYGFQPNSNARNLKQQSGRRVAVIVKGTQNMLFAAMVEHIQRGLQDHALDATLYYLDEEANEVAFARQVCREYKPPAILFLGGDLEFFRKDFHSITVPCALLTNTAEEFRYPNLSSVTTDDEAGAATATNLLLEQGHRNIGILGGSWSSTQIGFSRIRGALGSLERRGLTVDADRISESCRYSMDDGYAAAGRLLDRCPELTAIFALSDVIAIGAIRAIRDRGLRVPEDVSVVGFDGVPLSRFLVPCLATVRQDTARIAHRGVELLVERMDRELPPVHERIPFQLMTGESVAPARN